MLSSLEHSKQTKAQNNKDFEARRATDVNQIEHQQHEKSKHPEIQGHPEVHQTSGYPETGKSKYPEPTTCMNSRMLV